MINKWDSLFEEIKDYEIYDVRGMDDWIQQVKKLGDGFRKSIENYHKEYKWHQERASELDQALGNMRIEKHRIAVKLDAVEQIVDEFCKLYDKDEDDKFASAVLFQIKNIIVGGKQ